MSRASFAARQTTVRPAFGAGAPHAAAGGGDGDEDSLAYCCSSCDRLVSASFGWVGWKAATVPRSFLGFSVFLATLACLGYFNFSAAADPASKYTPYNSVLFEQQDAIATDSGFLHAQSRYTHVMLQHPSEDARDIFAPAYLWALFQVRQTILDTTALHEDDNGTTSILTLRDVCARGTALGALGRTVPNSTISLADECALQGPTDFWSNVPANMLADTNLFDTVLASTSAAPRDATGRPVRVADVVSARSYSGGSSASGSATAMRGAAGFRFTLELLNRPDSGGGAEQPRTPAEDSRARAWEKQLRLNLAALTWTASSYPAASQAAQSSGVVYASSFDGFALSVLSPELVRSEVEAGYRHDEALLIAGFFLAWLYGCAVLFRRNFVRSRMGMSVAAVATAALAMTCAVGAGAGLGLHFHDDLVLLAFLLLSVGLGDSFVLLACIQPFEPSWRQATPFQLSNLANKVASRFWWIRAAEAEGVVPIARQGRRRRRGGGDAAAIASGADVDEDLPDRDDDDRSIMEEEESIEGGISVGCAAAGPFITVTSLTLMCIFLIGAYTIIPAFRSFCLHAALGIAFLWLFHFCFFLPLLCIDAHRQNAHHCDAPCCCLPAPGGGGRGGLGAGSSGVEDQCCAPSGTLFDENSSSLCGRWIGSRLLAAVFHPFGNFVVLVLFVAGLTAGIWGCSTTLSAQFDPTANALVRDVSGQTASAAARAVQVRDALFPLTADGATEIRFYAVSASTDFFASMDAMDTLSSALGSASATVYAAGTNFWWSDYKAYLASTAPYSSGSGVTDGKPVSQTVFATSLEEFLNSASGAQYWQDVIPLSHPAVASTSSAAASALLPLGGGLRSMRLRVRTVSATSTSEQVDIMDSLRSLGSSAGGSSLGAFPFHANWSALEYSSRAVWEVVRHLLIGIAVLFVAMLFLLSANLWAALLVVLLTSVVVVDTLGLIAFAGLNLTPQVAMCTLLYVPLGLGFFVRPVQGYLRALGTRDHRARRTFEKIGGVVVDYMVVLFSVVLFLAAAQTRSLFASFATLAILVALGLFHGMGLLPVVLQWIGPAATFESEIVLADVNVESNTTAHLGGPQVASSAASGAAAADPANPFAFTPQQQHRLQQQQRQQQQLHQQTDAATGSGSAVEMGHWRVSDGEHEASQSRSHHDHHAVAGLENRTPQKPQQQVRWV